MCINASTALVFLFVYFGKCCLRCSSNVTSK